VQSLDVLWWFPVFVGIAEPEPEQCETVSAGLSVGSSIGLFDALDNRLRVTVTPLIAVLEGVVYWFVDNCRGNAVVTVVPANVVVGGLCDQSLWVNVIGRVVTVRVLVHRIVVGACLFFHAGGLLPDPVGAEASWCISVVVCHKNV
jgi:hypothetical protein